VTVRAGVLTQSGPGVSSQRIMPSTGPLAGCPRIVAEGRCWSRAAGWGREATKARHAGAWAAAYASSGSRALMGTVPRSSQGSGDRVFDFPSISWVWGRRPVRRLGFSRSHHRVRDGTLAREHCEERMRGVELRVGQLLREAAWRAEKKTAGMAREIPTAVRGGPESMRRRAVPTATSRSIRSLSRTSAQAARTVSHRYNSNW